ncbi:hypothetical protein GGR56DRAFT_660967 [Xylariaceae sp. FL0804]|nr:hypothetical protein GGR56DRAFT_660967 [Xylariaceae sp. FL0804]
MSYYFWWLKPQQVETPTVLHCQISISKILEEADVQGVAAFDETPLEYVQKSSQAWERWPMFRDYDLERSGSGAQAVGRISDDAILPAGLPPRVLAALIVTSMIHSCIHLLCWNLAFPTWAEQQIWRASAVVLASVSSFSIGMVRLLAATGYKGQYSLAWLWVNIDRRPLGSRAWWPGIWDVILGASVLALVLTRSLIIIEAIISLRHLPADAFQTVDWTDFIPHV